VTALLRRAGWQVNRKRVERIWRREGLKVPQKQPKRGRLPIRLVAALHDTSVAMIERHYSRCITEGLDELVARAVVPIVARAA
jgi:hypothetical protein